MKCNRIPVGDHGQRYETHYIHVDTKEDHVFGWSDEPDKLSAACDLMPSAASMYTLDRETKHQWTVTRFLRNAPFCQLCGIVRLASEKNKPCKGPTKMRKMENSRKPSELDHSSNCASRQGATCDCEDR